MKIIFLDVDGVLNSSTTSERLAGRLFVSDKKIAMLKSLVVKTKAEIVLTSTWRQGWYRKEHNPHPTKEDQVDICLFQALCEKLNSFHLKIIGYTPSLGNRGLEIATWLKNWAGEKIESYVILDDMCKKELQPFSRQLIQTSFSKGLTKGHIRRAIKILNSCYS